MESLICHEMSQLGQKAAFFHVAFSWNDAKNDKLSGIKKTANSGHDPYFYYDEESYKKALIQWEKDKMEMVQMGIIDERVSDVMNRLENEKKNNMAPRSVKIKLDVATHYRLRADDERSKKAVEIEF